MPEQKYIATVDGGRTGFKINVWQYDPADPKLTPTRIYNDKIEFEDREVDGLTTEGTEERLEWVKRQIKGLSPEIRENMPAVFFDSHGASVVLTKNGQVVAAPAYDHDIDDKYENEGEMRARFHEICGDQDSLYLETSTPALPAALNALVLVNYILEHHRETFDKADSITSLSAYLAHQFLGDGKVSMDRTTLYNHGYYVNTETGELSSAVHKLAKHYGVDLPAMFGDIKESPFRPLGTLAAGNEYGLREGTIGISSHHDSSVFAFLAQLARFKTCNSTGTWQVPMSSIEEPLLLEPHMQQWEVLYNADVLGNLLRTGLFRGGDMVKGYSDIAEATLDMDFDPAVLDSILESHDYITPWFMDGHGPYKHPAKGDPVVSTALLQDKVRFMHALGLSLAFQSALCDNS